MNFYKCNGHFEFVGYLILFLDLLDDLVDAITLNSTPVMLCMHAPLGSKHISTGLMTATLHICSHLQYYSKYVVVRCSFCTKVHIINVDYTDQK